MYANVPLTVVTLAFDQLSACVLLLSLFWFSVSFSPEYLWVGGMGCV